MIFIFHTSFTPPPCTAIALQFVIFPPIGNYLHKHVTLEYYHFSQQCIVNGLSYEKIAEDGSTISSLEVFFSGYARMVGLSLFPRLCQLTLVGQSISHIQGLECCPLLQELWVVECQLTLQKLYLYDNQISEIQNLELQVNLQVLWLNNNCISHIKVLNLHGNSLSKLKEISCLTWPLNFDQITALNLDSQRISKLTNLDKLVNLRWASFNDNDISKVEGLDNCLHLEELSLNNNCINIYHLKANHRVIYLRISAPLFHQGLTNLIILDLYGNPLVEKLENYRIYVVFQLPSLKALDGIAVVFVNNPNQLTNQTLQLWCNNMALYPKC
uniref:Uncharacterized protein n=1 Tax=Myripristis murdjan TaxID=586833 RepID=A0A668A9G4_9TELE